MRVRYTGDYYKVYLENGRIYDAELVDGRWYRIFDSDDEDWYLYDKDFFEVVS